MAKYKIKALAPGSYVYPLGILATDSEVDVPETITVGERGREKVFEIGPHRDWVPLDQAAVDHFTAYNRKPIDPGEFGEAFGLPAKPKPAAAPEAPKDEAKKAVEPTKGKRASEQQ